MNKKADGGFSLIITVVAIFLVVWWLVSVSQRECNKNSECNSESYCGSDFACHQYPNIQKTVIQYNFFLPSVIVAIALILAAFILRWDRIFKNGRTITFSKHIMRLTKYNWEAQHFLLYNQVLSMALGGYVAKMLWPCGRQFCPARNGNYHKMIKDWSGRP